MNKLMRNDSQTTLGVSLVCFAVALLLLLPSEAWPAVSDREVEAGDIIGGQVLPLKGGGEFALPSGDGLTIVLFWSTWSPRSLPALELWNKFSMAYSDQSLSIITVNAEKDELTSSDRTVIDQYLVESSVTLPVHIDEGLELFNSYGVSAVPTVFFLDNKGEVLYRYASFPTSAPLDLEEELEIRLGLRQRQTEEEVASRGNLDYQPKNNALLYYNMGVQLFKKGFHDKAMERFVIALQKDPDYEDPLRTLEGVYFSSGTASEGQDRLEKFLVENGLETLIEQIGIGEPIVLQAPKKIDAAERMRLLLEKKKESTGTNQ
jgi:thiol-disulfide isomerase/thioredoxin